MEEAQKFLLFGILCVFGGCLIQCTYGYFYTIGNMATYIADYMIHIGTKVDKKWMVWFTTSSLAGQALVMPLGGVLSQKYGFRLPLILGNAIHCFSIFSTYFAVKAGFTITILTYGVLQGMGFGVAYSVIISTATQWFPKKRGLIVGAIVGGFGAGALVFTPLQTFYINPDNVKINATTEGFTDEKLLGRVPSWFLIAAAITSTFQIVGTLLMRARPKEDGVVQSTVNPTAVAQPRDFSVRELFKSPDFYLLWLAFCCAVYPITTVSSYFKLFGQSYIDDDQFLAAIATMTSIFNAGGRIVWGSIADKLSFKLPLCMLFSLWAILLFTLPQLYYLTGPLAKVTFAIWVGLLFFCLSGPFVLAPTATSILFGPRRLAVNYGIIYNVFIFGGLLSGLINNSGVKTTAYRFQFFMAGFACLLDAIYIRLQNWKLESNLRKSGPDYIELYFEEPKNKLLSSTLAKLKEIRHIVESLSIEDFEGAKECTYTSIEVDVLDPTIVAEYIRNEIVDERTKCLINGLTILRTVELSTLHEFMATFFKQLNILIYVVAKVSKQECVNFYEECMKTIDCESLGDDESKSNMSGKNKMSPGIYLISASSPVSLKTYGFRIDPLQSDDILNGIYNVIFSRVIGDLTTNFLLRDGKYANKSFLQALAVENGSGFEAELSVSLSNPVKVAKLGLECYRFHVLLTQLWPRQLAKVETKQWKEMVDELFQGLCNHNGCSGVWGILKLGRIIPNVGASQKPTRENVLQYYYEAFINPNKRRILLQRINGCKRRYYDPIPDNCDLSFNTNPDRDDEKLTDQERQEIDELAGELMKENDLVDDSCYNGLSEPLKKLLLDAKDTVPSLETIFRVERLNQFSRQSE